MIEPEDYARENERLQLLCSYAILDTLPEKDYDNLAKLAAEICGTPISLVTLLDDNRQWFKSNYGLEMSQTPKEFAFCAHAIKDDTKILMVEDARKDIRFKGNPLVEDEPHIVFYAGVPLRGADGLPLGTLCVIDHQPKRLSENQIRALNILSNQVMNLLELRKKKMQLEMANSVLESNNLALERFANLVAHDLKSPLNNIISLARSFNVLYGDKLTEEGLKLIGYIRNSADSLKNLIDGLLDYSKSVSFVKAKKSPILLETFWKDIAQLFSSVADCAITFKSDLQYINANTIAVQQIIINLISNAIKYNDKKQIEIELCIKAAGENYHITVMDNGMGISKKNQDEIFELFHTLSIKDRFGKIGTGIGLATVARTVNNLGGKISIDSEIGKGTSFTCIVSK